jgi:hypothetical protein
LPFIRSEANTAKHKRWFAYLSHISIATDVKRYFLVFTFSPKLDCSLKPHPKSCFLASDTPARVGTIPKSEASHLTPRHLVELWQARQGLKKKVSFALLAVFVGIQA